MRAGALADAAAAGEVALAFALTLRQDLGDRHLAAELLEHAGAVAFAELVAHLEQLDVDQLGLVQSLEHLRQVQLAALEGVRQLLHLLRRQLHALQVLEQVGVQVLVEQVGLRRGLLHQGGQLGQRFLLYLRVQGAFILTKPLVEPLGLAELLRLAQGGFGGVLRGLVDQVAHVIERFEGLDRILARRVVFQLLQLFLEELGPLGFEGGLFLEDIDLGHELFGVGPDFERLGGPRRQPLREE